MQVSHSPLCASSGQQAVQKFSCSMKTFDLAPRERSLGVRQQLAQGRQQARQVHKVLIGEGRPACLGTLQQREAGAAGEETMQACSGAGAGRQRHTRMQVHSGSSTAAGSTTAASVAANAQSPSLPGCPPLAGLPTCSAYSSRGMSGVT